MYILNILKLNYTNKFNFFLLNHIYFLKFQENIREYFEHLRKDNEELRNIIKGRFDDGQQINTLNDNSSGIGRQGYIGTNTNLNQTNSIIRVKLISDINNH